MHNDLCPSCGASLWKPHDDFPEIMLRFVHLHEGRKVREILKFLPCDPSLDEREAKKHGRITPAQEWAIQRILEERRTDANPEGSQGALLADDMGVGKSGQLAEVLIRGGFQRALVVGLPDTHLQLRDRIYAQSDGAILPRLMNGTIAGRFNLAAFLKGEAGVFIAGSHFLVAQDFESRLEYHEDEDGKPDLGRPRWKMDNKTGWPKLKERVTGPEREVHLVDRAEGEIGPAQVRRVVEPGTPDQIGPALVPIQATKSHHLATFRAKLKKHPVDFIGLDECQVIANKHSQARRTLLSMGNAFKLAMSGTWFLNNPENMHSVTRWVWPGDDPVTGQKYVESNHALWKAMYLTTVPVLKENGDVLYRRDHLGKLAPVMSTTGEKEPGAFVATLPCYIRREADDPIPAPLELYVDPSPAQAEQIADLKRDLMTWVWSHEGTEEPLMVNMPAELHTRMRQVTIGELSLTRADGAVDFAPNGAFAKGGPLRYLLEERWAGQQVGVYTDSKIGAHWMAARLQRAGVDARVWSGDLSRGAREKLKQAFIRGEFRVLISTIQSFGVGIDGLQKVCDKVAWISDVEGSPALNDQAIRRYLRPGRLMRNGRDEFEHARILMRDSVDVESFQALIGKAWNMRASMTAATAA